MINDLPMGLELGSSTPRSLVSSQNITILYDFGMVKMGPLLKKRHLQLKDSPRSATLNTRSVRRKRLRALPLGHVEPQGWLKEVLTVLMWRFEGKQKNKLMQYHQLCPSRCITKYMDSCHQPIEAVMPTSHGCEAIRLLPYMHAFVLTCFYDI